MNASILSIGDELVLGQSDGSNAAWLAEQLAAIGVVTIEHRTVADDRAAIAGAIRDLAARVNVLLITGGLGPTQDDLTRHALGDVLAPGEALVSDADVEAQLRRMFAKRNREMPPANLVQAMRPPVMEFIQNPLGTAMGLGGRLGDCLIFAMPGPPREMQPMFRRHVAPAIAAESDGAALRTLAIHEFGLGESDAEQRLGELTARMRDPLVGLTVSEGIVTARIRARGESAAIDPQINETAKFIAQQWGPYAFGRENETLASSLLQLLRKRKQTLATAESCTGGLLGAMIVSVAGSSDVYRGGWITYGNEMKSSMIGVPAAMIETHGAVSEEVATALAIGARERAHPGADWAISITGIAGPDGGTASKPVGTVYIGIAGSAREPHVRLFCFAGDRQQIRDRSAKAAMQMLRFAILDAASTPLLWETPLRAEANA